MKIRKYAVGDGIPISERVLINRISRGSFSFSFTTVAMDALWTEALELPKQVAMYPAEHQPEQALTKADLRCRALNNPGS